MNNRVLPRTVEALIEAFARLPGIGPKSASRLTYYLLRAPESESQALAQALDRVREGTIFCSRCHNITAREDDPCVICEDEAREAGVLCVVEEPLDVLDLGAGEGYVGQAIQQALAARVTLADVIPMNRTPLPHVGQTFSGASENFWMTSKRPQSSHWYS